MLPISEMFAPAQDLMAALELLMEKKPSASVKEICELAGVGYFIGIFSLISLGECGHIRRQDDLTWSVAPRRG